MPTVKNQANWLCRLISTLVIIIIIGISQCHAAVLKINDFEAFCDDYYLQPQPDKINSALEAFLYYGKQWINKDENLKKIQIASFARFFAVLSITNPSIQQFCLQTYPLASWNEKMLIIEILSRMDHTPQLVESVKQWALAEEDDEKRIMLEHSLLIKDSETEILSKPLEHIIDVKEQWAYFSATGNTQVVENCLAILQQTYSKNSLLLEHDFHETLWRELAIRTYKHPKILQTILQNKSFLETKIGNKLLVQIATQAMDIRNGELFDLVQSEIVPRWTNSPEILFRKGISACLKRNFTLSNDTINQLDSQGNTAYAEWLRGYRNWFEQTNSEMQWVQSSTSITNNAIVEQFSKSLATIDRIKMMDFWIFQPPPQKDHVNIYYLKTLQQQDSKSICVMSFDSFLTEIWVYTTKQLLYWSDKSMAWINVKNRTIKKRICSQVGLKDLKTYFQQITPDTIQLIKASPTEKIYHLQYSHNSQLRFLNKMISEYYEKASIAIKQLDVFIDSRDYKLRSMKIAFDITVDNQVISDGQFERYFYDIEFADHATSP